jgi:hypothetical protein
VAAGNFAGFVHKPGETATRAKTATGKIVERDDKEEQQEKQQRRSNTRKRLKKMRERQPTKTMHTINPEKQLQQRHISLPFKQLRWCNNRWITNIQQSIHSSKPE